MENVSVQFDELLFSLKLQGLSRQMQTESVAAERLRGPASQRVDAQIEVLRRYLVDVDQICRGVWQTQGMAITPEFVREILLPKIILIIEARAGGIKGALESMAVRTHTDVAPAQGRLVSAVRELKSEVSNRYEAEAREMSYEKATRTPGFVSNAPKPITPLRGEWTRPSPKPTQIPPNPPTNFPRDSWPKTIVILVEATRRFPHQTQTLELCKHVISEMTPLFSEAVKTGRMKAGAVFCQGLGGMEDLLHSLLVYNDDGTSSGFGLSNEAYRLGQEARKSDEWLKLAREVAEVSVEPASQEPAPRSQPDATMRPDRGGRPRKDDERRKVGELRSQGKTWTQVAIQMNRETDQNKSKDAYRNLLRSGTP